MNILTKGNAARLDVKRKIRIIAPKPDIAKAIDVARRSLSSNLD